MRKLITMIAALLTLGMTTAANAGNIDYRYPVQCDYVQPTCGPNMICTIAVCGEYHIRCQLDQHGYPVSCYIQYN